MDEWGSVRAALANPKWKSRETEGHRRRDRAG